ncbi:MAG: 6-pyruvoyl trahydropterin synthase family protein [Candidatus Kariarchaeaceae archaeon]
MSDSNVVTIYKVQSISSAHQLDLPYDSKCNRVHGHNYRFEMYITGKVDVHGMVVDFHHLKKVVNSLDHVNLNDVLDVPTTAENLAIHVTREIIALRTSGLHHVKVRVWETETAYAEFEQQL